MSELWGGIEDTISRVAGGSRGAALPNSSFEARPFRVGVPRGTRSHFAREFCSSPEKAGRHMYYGGGGRYLYQPIPKNACTTIKTLLLQVEDLPVDSNWWHRHQKEYNGFPGTNHLPLSEQLDIFEGHTDTFKFVFARNPYARLASAYHDKLRVNVAPHIVRKIKLSAAAQGVALSDPITFAEFVTVVSRQCVAEMDSHWRPQYYEGCFSIVKFDFVGRLEALHSDLIYVLECIDAPETVIAQAHRRNHETGSSVELWHSVPPDVHRLFLKVFEVDFDVLRYPIRLPKPLRQDNEQSQK
jgi:hypothetical protein